MGISVISSYRGGYNFEAVGPVALAGSANISPACRRRISGIGLAGIQTRCELHAEPGTRRRPPCRSAASTATGAGARATRFEAGLIHQLQTRSRPTLSAYAHSAEW